MTLPPAAKPAAPGVTKEVEDALSECLGAAVLAARWPEDYLARAETAKTALLAAIEKYGKDQYEAGVGDEAEGQAYDAQAD